jgi:hypothetical protein
VPIPGDDPEATEKINARYRRHAKTEAKMAIAMVSVGLLVIVVFLVLAFEGYG